LKTENFSTVVFALISVFALVTARAEVGMQQRDRH
jgi:hypothetical protein